ncbi:hypothetical protein F4680DRAFT_466122 [Xylaria scruposa]|nr:hypothetical protein F4680DRAFT_466122 [Xylaria scruposa]
MNANNGISTNQAFPLHGEELDAIWSLNGPLPDTSNECIHERIASRGADHPNKIAVVAWDGQLSYRELERLSTQLACQLTRHGVGARMIVPLCFEKSMWTVVAMLGVLKAGGAFALFDVSQPERRLLDVIQQCDAKVVCSSVSSRELCSRTQLPVLVVGPGLQKVQPEIGGIRQLDSDPTWPMYVCFTSGSTGRPKGIVITHSAFCSARQYQSDAFGFHPNARVFDFAAYSFDVAVYNAMMTLSIGACLCIPSEEQRKGKLNQTLQDMGVTIAALTPSASRLLKPEKLPDLQTLILSGEAVSTGDLARLKRGNLHVINAYGPAECTPMSTLNANAITPGISVDIGKGIGALTWVVDPNDYKKLVPMGATGELLLEGPILAEGYLGEPEKTEAAFITDPPWLLQGAPSWPGRRGRLYKTGDLVRYNTEGNLDFVGRKDGQVKLHGQRLELGEVEHHVRRHMSQGDHIVANVIELGGQKDRQALAVFLTGRGGWSDPKRVTEDLELVRVHRNIEVMLKQSLPSYMVPTLYFRVSVMPLSATGKIDRRRLCEMGAALSAQRLVELRGSSMGKHEPQTETETLLRDLWAEALGVEVHSISTDDDFFLLGGDSIAAIKLVGAAGSTGIALSVAAVFRCPTIEAQAQTQADTVARKAETLSPFSLLEGTEVSQITRKVLSGLCNLADPSLVDDAYPCTPLQEGMISLAIKRAGDYVLQAVLELHESVQLQPFKAAWEEISRSTTMLRTRIVQHGELGLLQVVCREEIEWTQARDLDDYLEKDNLSFMGLGDRLSRFALIGNPHKPRWFVWTIHHALYDGWSLQLVTSLVKEVFQGNVGKGSIIKRPRFSNFVKHTLETRNNDVDSYWNSYLANNTFATFPSLPTTVREPVANATIEVRLPSVTRAGATLSTMLRSALAIVISLYTDSTDLVFGATVSGRNASVSGVEKILGPTIATVPVRMKIPKDEVISDYVRKVQQDAVDMIPYEQIGLQRLSRLSEEGRNACRFQTLLVVQPQEDEIDSDDIFGKWQTSSTQQRFSTYAITLECFLTKDGIRARASFDTRVMDEWRMGKMLQQFGAVLEQLASGPDDLHIGDIKMFTAEDRAIIQAWNQPKLNVVDTCIHDLISNNAQVWPDAPAIEAWDGKLSHRELDELSTQLSRHLVALGVGPEVFVPLCFEKSLFTIVAMLGVLKSGGAFVLLDPGLPDNRLRELCGQVKARVAVTSSSCQSRLSDFIPSTLVLNWQFFKLEAPPGREGKHMPSDPSNAAYIIFTSGSTGVPKGVIIEHRSYCSAIISHRALNVNSSTRSLQFGSYNFAGAILEILMPLIHGGCLCIPSEEQRGTQLAKTIRRLNANWAFLTSTVLANLTPEDVPCLQTVCVGGESIRSSQIAQWSSKVQLRQTYGSAELSGVVGSARLNGLSVASDVGKPLSGRIWLVDPTNIDRLAPLGVAGEIIFEGQVVGREYIGQPQKTAEAFIRTPAWRASFDSRCQPASRFYKTGDLAVYKSDGSIQLLGRKDTQVKLRGQRIEVGEVEHQARLASQNVEEVVVELTTLVGSMRGPELVGFLLLRDRHEIDKQYAGGEGFSKSTAATLQCVQARLESELPYYMVPSLLVLIPQLPLTASKKTDRRRLREIGSDLSLDQLRVLKSLAAGQQRRPRTAAERRLLGLWADVLSVDANSIGINDNFFMLGGDSIAVMKLVGLARKSGLSLTVADMFRNPTLVAQAQVVKSAKHAHTDIVRPFSLISEDQAISGVQRELAVLCDVDDFVIEDAYPCTPLQKGLLSLTAKRTGDYIMQAVLELSEDVHLDIFQAAWETAVKAIAILRTRIVHHSRLELLQVVCNENIRWVRAQSLVDYLEQDKARPMGLGHQLSRYCLVDDGESRYFVWTIHHALFDGWSLPLILDVVYNEYSANSIGNPAAFNSFVKYTVGLPEEQVSEFWQSYFVDGDFAPFPPLPSSVQEPIADATLTMEFPSPALNSEATTTSMLIRGALALLIHQYTGSSDILLGATVSGRSAPVAAVDEIIGPTIATVPIRVLVDGEQPVADYLDMVQRGGTDMIPYEQTGLQRIAKINKTGREAVGFQTLLVVHPQEDETIGPSDLLGKWHTSSPTHNQGFVTYAITLECYLGSETIRIKTSFDTRVISTWKMNVLLQHLNVIVDRLSDPKAERTVRDICAITKEDARTISEWNQLAEIEVSDTCIHHLIAEHTQQRPDEPAVQAWDGRLTYHELDALSEQLASYLAKSYGVAPEVVVPLCFEKSMWTVVAMLGVLKAGGAFVLLDPSLPYSRLETICRQVKATTSMSSVSCRTRLSDFTSRNIVVSWELLRALPTSGPRDKSYPRPNDAAYIIFTSGSTGEPKGVIIEHRAYCSAAIGHGSRMDMSTDTRTLQFGSYNFAGAIMEMLMTLIYGGCVCIPSEEQRGTRLVQTIREMKANWAFLTSTVLAKMSPEDVPSLSTICVGGEPIRSAQIKQWASQVNLRQTYGSSETSAVVSSAALTPSSAIGDVGNATTGRYWIVNPRDSDELVPIGAPGEVLIEGPTIGREYVGDAERSSKAFISPPTWRAAFGHSHGGFRFYKTGDLASYKPDGSIELLGRKDTQVKLRGQRIETGEVEYHAKLATTAVKEAVVELVSVQDSQSRGPELLGFLVMETDDAEVSHNNNRDNGVLDKYLSKQTRTVIQRTQARLESVLPHYMVPSIFVPIRHLPLTVSGKTDRRRLREIGSTLSVQDLATLRIATRSEKRNPRTKAEYRLRAIWSQVLNIEADSIGMDDNFFRLGGDSIAAMKLVAAARRVDIMLAVADIFRNPILSAQACIEMSTAPERNTEVIKPFSLLSRGKAISNVRDELASICALDASSIEDAYPCTPLQEGLLSLTTKRAGDYIMQAVLELSNNVNISNFQLAWGNVVASTPILRTRIVHHRQSGALVQVVCKEGINWTKTENLEHYLLKDKQTAMGLGDRLSRFSLVGKDPNKPRFMVWTLHHVLYDGWSLPLLLELVSNTYRGIPISNRTGFNTFVERTLHERDANNALAFWRSYLADGEFPSFPAFSASTQGPKADDILEYSLPLDTKKTEATVSTLLRGALAILICQYTGSTDVVFGATVSGRNAAVAGIDEIIGPTIATVPVRVQLQPQQNSTVSEFLDKIQQEATEMIAYEQTGLHRIAKLSESCHSACGFQTLLVVQPEEELQHDNSIGIWKISPDQEGFISYAIALECTLKPEEVALKAYIDTSIVSKWQVQNIVQQLGGIVNQLANAQPAQLLQEINILTAKDEETIWNWNRSVPKTITESVHDLISQQEQGNPDLLAVSAWDGEFSYRELGELSSKLAFPLYFEKSKWAIVAMLAVLKAGGAFLLIDPTQAVERTRTMLKSSAGIILTSTQHADILAHVDYNIIPVNAETLSSLPHAGATLQSHGSPDTAAYVVFTSGSTGQPKGILINQHAMASSCVYFGQATGFGQSTRTLHFSSYAFDAFVVEIFATLVFGGCVYIPSDSDRLAAIDQSITSSGVNTVILTPSVIRLLKPATIQSLQNVILCGEAPSNEDLKRLTTVPALFNGYGPAECTVCCSIGPINFNESNSYIGRAHAAVSWLVRPEDHSRLVPIGSVGELLIEGPVLARNYISNLDATTAAFIEDPAWLLKGTSTHPGRRGRLYKTGDLVRYNENGTLTYIGRKDMQVKIRGQRVELGEVEYQARECLGSDCEAVADIIELGGGNGKAVLSLFVASRTHGKRCIDDLFYPLSQVSDDVKMVRISNAVEAALSQRLPSYMIPTIYFQVTSLPQLASGKVDRKRLRGLGALLSPETLANKQTTSQKEKRQPQTGDEQLLRDIWAQVLNIEAGDIGIDDSFIRLGGDSITAMIAVGEARKLGFELGVADVLHQSGLHYVAGIARHSPDDSHKYIPQSQIEGPIEQSYAQGRLWFLDQLYPGSTQYLMPIAIRLRGRVDLDALNAALLAVENRHETLRTTFSSKDSLDVQIVRPFQPSNLKIIDVASNDELLHILQREQSTPFNLNTDPGWRLLVYRLNKEEHVLSIVMHHIISDGWSTSILQRELAAFYSASIRGQDPLSQVNPLPIQYRDYALWQKTEAQIDKHQQQLEYWTAELDNSQPAELLCDKPRPAILSGKADVQEMVIQGYLYDAVMLFCKEYEVTPFVVLLAAFRATHYRLTGSKDATIGTANANRDQWQVADIIGFFVNMQCIRIKFEDESFEQLVRQVQATTKASLENQDVPFEKIVSRLKNTRDLSRQPLVQVVFTLHSQSDLGQFKLEGVETEQVNLALTSRFDLEFHFTKEETCLRGEVAFSTDLYDSRTINSLLSLFRTVLGQCLKTPKADIESLSLMTHDDFLALQKFDLARIHQTDYSPESSVVDVFLQQVTAYPDKVAVKDPLSHLTYAELNKRSDQLARWLTKQSFANEKVVGVYAGRSCQTIIAFLGILKANLAYVPLDVNSPASRVESIISSIGGHKLVLLGPGTQPPITKLKHVKFVSIEGILKQSRDTADNQSPINSAPSSATSLAYVMFTSGSTGKPKGVLIEHRGIVRLARQNDIVNALPKPCTMAHMGNIAFDITTWEIYATILNGGTLVCIDNTMVLDTDFLINTFSTEKIQSAILTPAFFRQCLLEAPSVISQLDVLLVGGDRVDGQDLISAQATMKGKVYNAYGPTENTVISTFYEIPRFEGMVNGVPIGRAISNSGAYVVDSLLRLVPIGVVGELVVTGDGLARGYTDPQQNFNRFISIEIDGKLVRAYRTGDYVRYRPTDGQMEFFGRIDGQVKVRGHRIEFGEIESALRRHVSVKDAVVVSTKRNEHTTQLAGFVTIFEDESEENDTGDTEDGDESQHVKLWETLFDSDKYTTVDSVSAETIGRDFTAWTSMYDGTLIDKDEMNEWLEDTIRSILNGGEPGNVLEVGTGTGMILFNLINGLQSYVGLEPTSTAIDFVNKTARSIPALRNKVQMYKGTATDVYRLEKLNSPNLVVINSVVQYFPSLKYLQRVVENLVRLKGVKTIFFGDIRSFALYNEFKVTKALHQLGQSAHRDEIERHVAETDRLEQELLVDPAFFTALADQLPQVVEHVEIIPKRMKATNELSCYRYGAVLHLKDESYPLQIHEISKDGWVDFMEQQLDQQSLIHLLRKHCSVSSAIAVSNIPYDKTVLERHVVDSLANATARKYSDHEWLSSIIQDAHDCSTLSVADLEGLARSAGCRVEISWARQYSKRGGFDAVFHHYRPSDHRERVLFNFPTDHCSHSSRLLSSRPLRRRLTEKIRIQLQERLRDQVPSYMIPQTITVLEKMPVTENGKVDRRALAEAVPKLVTPRGTKQQPTSQLEQQLQDIWAQVLLISDATTISVDDSFFEIGGDSIIAMKAVTLARKAGIELSVADIFRHPTLTALAQSRTTITNGHTDTIKPFELLQGGREAEGIRGELAILCATDVSFIEDAYPCTPLQEGLLSLTAKRQGSYVMQAILQISDHIDLARLKLAWEEVVAFTAILRTRVVEHEQLGLTQVVCGESVEWNESEDLEEYLKMDNLKPMGLGDTLSRFAIVSEGDASPSRCLVWTIHHALYDGWSLPRIMRLVSDVYNRRCTLSGQSMFNVFVKHLLRTKSADAETFWRSYLAHPEFNSFPELPSTVQEPVADTVLETRLAPRVKSKFTMSTMINGALAILFSQYSNSADILFGTVVSGRNASVNGIEDILGPTIATVPTRIRFQHSQTIHDYLQTIQHEATEAIEFHQTGLQRIASIGEDGRRGLGFQTLLVIQPDDEELPEDDALGSWRTSSTHQGFSSTYAVVLECFVGGDEVRLKARFDSSVISKWQMENLTQQLGFILRQLTDGKSGRLVGNLYSLNPSHEAKIWELNKIVPEAVDLCIHERIDTLTKLYPDAPAICSWDGELTYRELETLSTRIALYLTDMGITNGNAVPLVFEKSMWVIVTMLAVLKVGAMFVPIDVTQGHDRRDRIIKETGAKIILSSAQNAKLLVKSEYSVVTIGPETLSSILKAKNTTAAHRTGKAPEARVTPASTAYIMYTSGSTGQPKGFRIDHRAISTSCFYHGRAMGFDRSTRTLQFSSFFFDVSILEIMTTLLCGGCVCVPSDSERLIAIEDAINRMDVNTCFFTPTVAQLLTPSQVPSITTIMLGGEKVLSDDINRWAAPNCVAFNVYGPAECSVVCAVNGSRTRQVGIPPVGRATGATLWIVSPEDHNRLMPIGAIGELVLEGHIVGQGYLGRPRETAAAFIAPPTWLARRGTQSRVYKSGDLAHYNEDGTITLVGRKDTQVKLRGQRLELSEVEFQVRHCVSAVSQAVAEITELAVEDKRQVLSVFLVVESDNEEGHAPSAVQMAKPMTGEVALAWLRPDIETALSQRLPAYMMPTLYFRIRTMPLMASDLADLRSLTNGAKRAPRTETEQRLQALWAQLLNINATSIGIEDSFLGLGGDSIAAMKLVMAARKIGIALTVMDVLKHGSLETLAARQDQNVRGAQPIRSGKPYSLLDDAVRDNVIRSSESLLAPEKVVDIYPITEFQKDVIKMSLLRPGQSMNYIFLDFGLDLDLDQLKASCCRHVKHHSLLRSVFISLEGAYFQVVLEQLSLPFPIVDTADDLPSASYKMCLADAETGFELGRPPTLFLLVRNKSQGSRLIIRLSHAQYDGFCLSTLITSLLDFYKGKIPPPTTSFSDFLWHKRSQLAASSAYWNGLLKGSSLTSIAQILLPKTSQLTARDSPLEKIVVEGDIHIPQLRGGITLASVTSSAWAIVLSEITGRKDVVYGSLVSGRDVAMEGIENVVGPCLDIVPVRAQVHENLLIHELFRSIQEQNLAAQTHALGLEQIIKHGTHWPADSEFESVVQYQGIDENPHFDLMGTTLKLGWMDSPYQIPPRFAIIFYPIENGVKIKLLANSHIISTAMAKTLLAALRKTIVRLVTSQNEPLSSLKLNAGI